jgi:hypothetical protein
MGGILDEIGKSVSFMNQKRAFRLVFWRQLLCRLVHNLAALVEAAIVAHAVGQAHLAAVGAGHHVAGLQGVMRPAAVAATLGMLAFWKWCHFFAVSSSLVKKQPASSAGDEDYTL